jgi:hypothetical protein
MTTDPNAKIYAGYLEAIARWRALPAAQQKSTPAPTWQDSAKKLDYDPTAKKAITRAQAEADLKAAEAEVASVS